MSAHNAMHRRGNGFGRQALVPDLPQRPQRTGVGQGPMTRVGMYVVAFQ